MISNGERLGMALTLPRAFSFVFVTYTLNLKSVFCFIFSFKLTEDFLND